MDSFVRIGAIVMSGLTSRTHVSFQELSNVQQCLLLGAHFGTWRVEKRAQSAGRTHQKFLPTRVGYECLRLTWHAKWGTGTDQTQHACSWPSATWPTAGEPLFFCAAMTRWRAVSVGTLESHAWATGGCAHKRT